MKKQILGIGIAAVGTFIVITGVTLSFSGHPNRAMTDVRQCGSEVQSRFVRTSNGKGVVEWRLAYYLMFCSLSAFTSNYFLTLI